MIANVMIYQNSQFLGHTDVIMNEGDTVDTPEVVEQINLVYGSEAWDQIEIVSIS
jgi:hypothetical protein